MTITLSPDLLQQIDRLVDQRTVRSRSHAIESLLRQSLTPVVSTAVLLAGGPQKGETLPALAPIDGQPLIRQQVEHLQSYGIRTIVILAGPHEAAIRRELGDRVPGIRLIYVSENEPSGTAGALKLAEPYLQSLPLFLVLHGDVLTDIDVADFVTFQQKENRLASIAVKPRQADPNLGKVLLQGNRITDFLQAGQEQSISIVNTGVYLLRPDVLSLVEPHAAAKLETEIFPRLASMGELSAFLFQGIWFDISSPANYRLAQERWRQKEQG
ncbi:MAG: sugar phosphate nucleotidyltransferase [Anaerolineae bacterium]|nr:sugar phosphate nucleotidyltransferase [Anaerolineae bacterium]